MHNRYQYLPRTGAIFLRNHTIATWRAMANVIDLHDTNSTSFEKKSISYAQSVCYIFNNAISPGLVALALVVSEGG